MRNEPKENDMRDGIVAQGDVMFIPIPELPVGLSQSAVAPIVVAHSETGHHHVVQDGEARMFERIEREAANPLVCYLFVDSDHVDVVHHRPWSTHEAIRLDRGAWEVRRQREHTPDGWRVVQD